MPPRDSSAIDNALVDKLRADATLAALMTDGAYADESTDGDTKFVIVSLIDTNDVAVFGGRAWEDNLYLVKAVSLIDPSADENGDVQAAAARIDELLEGGSLDVPGYGLMTMHREGRVREVEVDELDQAIRWNHRGGFYRVQMALTTP